MALVDYSSSEDDTVRQPPTKRQRDKPPPDESGAMSVPAASGPDSDPRSRSSFSSSSSSNKMPPMPPLPPLPPAFHDLYATTVRQSVIDDPSLHQGRKRQIPHVVGNWPTHVYVEWHPTRAQHTVLVQLVDTVGDRLGDKLGGRVKLHNFLTSDLGAPLPLHISLSRPMALSTASKDDFLEKTTAAIRRCGTGEFTVTPQSLAWYRSPDSNRTFLILRVARKPATDDADDAAAAESSPNPELMALLGACNHVAAAFDQPTLYQGNEDESADDAFHISIGWTFGLSVDEASTRALDTFKEERFRQVLSWQVSVSGVKAKIGNVVSHTPLAGEENARRGWRRPSTSLFGL